MLLSSHFCPHRLHFLVTTREYIFASGTLGRPTIGHSQPGEAQHPPLYWSVHLPARFVEAQLPVCLLHTGVCTTLVVGFSLTNKNPEYMGLTLKFQWSTLSPTSHFQPHQVVVIVPVQNNIFGSE